MQYIIAEQFYVCVSNLRMESTAASDKKDGATRGVGSLPLASTERTKVQSTESAVFMQISDDYGLA